MVLGEQAPGGAHQVPTFIKVAACDIFEFLVVLVVRVGLVVGVLVDLFELLGCFFFSVGSWSAGDVLLCFRGVGHVVRRRVLLGRPRRDGWSFCLRSRSRAN